MKQVDLCAKSYNNHQNTQLTQRGYAFSEPQATTRGRLIRSKAELILAAVNHVWDRAQLDEF